VKKTNQTMVYVSSEGQASIAVAVNGNDTIDQVKKHIFEVYKIPSPDQQVVFVGKKNVLTLLLCLILILI
jgi:hypothetical protein